MRISIVVPAYNEAAGIGTFHRELLMPELEKLGLSYEVVYVDDGSQDETLPLLQELAKHDEHVTVVALSRNFGKELAVTAGIAEADGDAVIIMDADGQHAPKYLPEFIKEWQAGAQVVVGVRRSGHGGAKTGSKVFNASFNSVSDTKMVPGATDYRLLDRAVCDVFLTCTERNRMTRGLIDWLGFRRVYVLFDAPERLAGTASYTFDKKVQLFLNGLVTMSLKPLSALIWVGGVITSTAFVLGLFLFVEQFLLADPMELNFSGSALLGVLITFLVGIVLTAQGLLALYVANIHEQTLGRPLYVVDPTSSVRLRNNRG